MFGIPPVLMQIGADAISKALMSGGQPQGQQAYQAQNPLAGLTSQLSVFNGQSPSGRDVASAFLRNAVGGGSPSDFANTAARIDEIFGNRQM